MGEKFGDTKTLPEDWRDGIVDHIDSKRTNDSFDNLQLLGPIDGISASKQNARKAKMNSSNTSGIRGICSRMDGNTKYWVAFIIDNEGSTLTKIFRDDNDGFEEAKRQRLSWVREFGFGYPEDGLAPEDSEEDDGVGPILGEALQDTGGFANFAQVVGRRKDRSSTIFSPERSSSW